MLKPMPVSLVAYDANWPRVAAEHAARLHVIDPLIVEIHHIGSTSVPGLTAKPIIDLLPVVTDLAALDRLQATVEALGYVWHHEYGVPGRRFCALHDGNDHRIVHVHFFEEGSSQITGNLSYRNYMRAHPEEARLYEIEKARARDAHPHDSNAYAREKSAWVTAALGRALAWNASCPDEQRVP